MEKMIDWLKTGDVRMLVWANRRMVAGGADGLAGKWFGTVTHMGGATFTLTSSLLCALLATGPWSGIGWKSLLAVIFSHIPVAIVKRKFKRLRPYQAIQDIYTCPKPLKDSSFPSGHTTAIFAWTLPIMLFGGIWSLALGPVALFIACSVGWSRMYLGLHYPSDVAAGALIGTATAFAVHYIV